MGEYKELIELLAHPADDRDNADIMISAADAIEQLVNDYEILAKMYAKVNEDLCVRTKERDALIADLKQASKIPYGGCHLCKSIRTEICKECYRSDMFSEIAKNPTDRWEWRGVQNEVLNNG